MFDEMLTSKLNCMSINFPNRLELSFLVVLAFPKASKTGFESKSLFLTLSISPFFSVTSEIYCNTFLDASVFPEPDSPARK